MRIFIDVIIRFFFKYESSKFCLKTKINKRYILTVQFLFLYKNEFRNLIIPGNYI